MKIKVITSFTNIMEIPTGSPEELIEVERLLKELMLNKHGKDATVMIEPVTEG